MKVTSHELSKLYEAEIAALARTKTPNAQTKPRFDVYSPLETKRGPDDAPYNRL